MRRRMPVLIAVLFVVVAFAGIVLAQAVLSPTAYLPIVSIERTATPIPTDTPIPTPTPPDISTLVIQLSEMQSGYARDHFELATNADSAKGYHDPKAAAAAFVTQGRETSWYTSYSSSDYAFSDALVVSNQVFRYLTDSGAHNGLLYTLGEDQLDKPALRPFNVSVPCCYTIGLRRTFTVNNTDVDEFIIISQVGRYVTETDSIGLSGVMTPDIAISYAQLALNHLLPVPQVMQSSDHAVAHQVSGGTVPSLENIRAAIWPH